MPSHIHLACPSSIQRLTQDVLHGNERAIGSNLAAVVGKDLRHRNRGMVLSQVCEKSHLVLELTVRRILVRLADDDGLRSLFDIGVFRMQGKSARIRG